MQKIKKKRRRWLESTIQIQRLVARTLLRQSSSPAPLKGFRRWFEAKFAIQGHPNRIVNRWVHQGMTQTVPLKKKKRKKKKKKKKQQKGQLSKSSFKFGSRITLRQLTWPWVKSPYPQYPFLGVRPKGKLLLLEMPRWACREAKSSHPS